MAHTVTKSTGYFSRIGNSLKGILVGFLLAVISVAVLWWNEGNALKTRQDLAAFQAITVSIPSGTIDPANDSKAVHTQGGATVAGMLSDPLFGVSAQALKLSRSVEMYQWKENSKTETRTKLGGGEESVTVYTHEKTWSSSEINSSDFKDPEAPKNPGPIPYPSENFFAEDATLGAFHLTRDIIGRIGGDEPLKPQALPATAATDAASAGDENAAREPEAAEAPAESPASATFGGREIHLIDNGYFLGKNPASPQVGDLRVLFKIIPPQALTVVGTQSGNTITAWTSERGKSFLEVARGSLTIEEVFAAAHSRNDLMMWVFRLGGFIVMGIGFSLVLKPLSVLADVLPIFGRLVGAVSGFAAFLGAACVSLVVIAVAWLFYRPVLATVLFLLAFGALYLAIRLLRKPKDPAALA